ncbi:response regulator transcription factor [Cypionkella sp.]|uniref:LuxR C-terminal-related transcriptional regulator n=1 Tax=Cypionkella sp. TaxID=2811411 RepID=UPI002633B5CA|nr:response regulator transcription factor [Cypionkella sp.]MDB5664060.1 narL [Cypionkella sp.]
MRKIYQVSVIDSDSLSSEGVKHALSGRGFHIVNRWRSVSEAIDCAPPAVNLEAILLNQAKNALPCEETVTELRRAYPGSRIALIGESSDPDRIKDAIKAEFDGFILETIHITAFPKAIELLILGERVFPPLPPDATVKQPPDGRLNPTTSALETLSASEMRVLALLANAMANKVIAQDLGISESTVKVHVKAILRKTGSRNRTDAALLVQGIGAKPYLDELANKKLNGVIRAPSLGRASSIERF